MRWLSVMRLAQVVRSNVDRQCSPNGRRGENGAVASLVAIMLGTGVLLGLGALVIDTGSLLYERRQLQNGADAAALSIVKTCVDGNRVCETPSVILAPSSAPISLAGANAADQKSDIDTVCASHDLVAFNPGWPECDPPGVPTPGLVQCPTPANSISTSGNYVGMYVEVRTKTLTGSGSSILPPFLAQALAGGNYSGEIVKACARVALGPPNSVRSALPVSISRCEFDAYTMAGLKPSGPYAPAPLIYPTPNTGPTAFDYEKAIRFHDGNGANQPLSCSQGPSGADTPGGFGYLQNNGCDATSITSGAVEIRSGNPSNTALGCDFTDKLSARTGQPVFLPIYNGLSSTQYFMDGAAAFWLTGFSTSGNRYNSDASGRELCNSSQTCLYGWFVSDIMSIGSFGTGAGTPRGAFLIGFSG